MTSGSEQQEENLRGAAQGVSELSAHAYAVSDTCNAANRAAHQSAAAAELGEQIVRFFFKQKTAYEIRPCDKSSDVCSSDLGAGGRRGRPCAPCRASGPSARRRGA